MRLGSDGVFLEDVITALHAVFTLLTALVWNCDCSKRKDIVQVDGMDRVDMNFLSGFSATVLSSGMRSAPPFL